MFRTKLYLLVALMCFGGLGLAGYGVKKYFEAQKLIAEGKPAIATVVERKTYDLPKRNKSYHLVLAFETERQQRVTNTLMVKRDMFDNAVAKATVEIIYLPSDPSVCVVGSAGQAAESSSIQVIVGSVFFILGVGLFFVLRKAPSMGQVMTQEQIREKIRPEATAAAKEISQQLSALCEARHEYAPVDSRLFKHLDLAFYDAQQRFLGSHGFQFLGDFEDLTLRNSANNPNTFIRLMLGGGGTIVAGLYHYKPTLLLRAAGTKESKTIDLETQFSNGCFVCTSNAGAVSILKQPSAVDGLYLSATTPPTTVLAGHQSRVAQFAVKSDARPVRLNGLEEVRRSSDELQRIKAEYRAGIGLTKQELHALAGPVGGSKRFREQAEDLLSEEILANPPRPQVQVVK